MGISAVYQTCRARETGLEAGLETGLETGLAVLHSFSWIASPRPSRGSGCLYVRGCLLCQLSMALGSLVVPKPMRMLTRRLVRAEWEKCEIRCGQSEVGAPDGQSTFNRADLSG